MTSRTDVYAIDIAEPLSSYLDEMLNTRHSRIPVYEEEIDNIIGILYIKDFILEARRCGFEQVDIRSHFSTNRIFVLEAKILTSCFRNFRNHISTSRPD